MPTTKARNLLYKSMLPFCAPSCGRKPVARTEGHPLSFEDLLSGLIRRHHVTGSAGLLEDGREQAVFFGFSFHADMVPDENTFFRVASITKMATALLVFVLADRGLLDPDAPVGLLMPDWSGVPELEGVTVRHLLSHTSGLSDPADMESLLLRSVPVPAAVTGKRIASPGSEFHYSNLGFGLLGCVIEAVLDLPVGTAFDRYLFSPLGMRASLEGCTLPEESIMPVVRILPYRPESAVTLTRLGRIPLDRTDPSRHYGHTAGSMYTDLLSLKKMLCCIRDHGTPLIRSGRFSMAERRASYGKLSPTLSYASGLLIINDPALSPGPVYGHQGFAYGCADGAFWDEETGRVLIQLNGGCSEARTGRLGCVNAAFLHWAFRKELPSWRP